MTRQEEIEQQTFVFYETCSDEDVAKSKGFIDGAKWADEHPKEELWKPEKVTNWLKQNFEHYAYNYGIDEVIVGLIKAMEE